MTGTYAIRFFDRELNFLGEIRNYVSLLYTCKWHTYGTFTVVLPGIHPLAQIDHMIMLGNDGRKNGIIKSVQYDQDADETTIKGYSLLWLLSSRITVPSNLAYTNTSGTVGAVMAVLVVLNATDPNDAARKIPLLEMGNIYRIGGSARYQSRYKNLAEELTTISKTYDIGIGIELDYKRKKMVFMAYEGVDRSVNQTDRSPYILNPAHYNVTNIVVTQNDTETKTCAYVGGKGEGSDRTICIVNDTLTGLDRREIFVDARDLEDAEGVLEARGQQELAELTRADSYEYEAAADGYGSKWDLGDRVTLRDKQFDITKTDRITEVEIAIDSTGVVITPILGTPEKTITEILTPAGSVAE